MKNSPDTPTQPKSVFSFLAHYWQAIFRSSKPFSTSRQYWIDRYDRGKTSGSGSYNKLAEFKAEILNSFVREHDIRTVLEFGCGDGNQLQAAKYPSYVGLDVSPKAIELCRNLFPDDPTKQFRLVDEHDAARAELALSLDVIYHLVEDRIFEEYMQKLFSTASRFVIIYSSNTDDNSTDLAAHVRHRRFSTWIETHQPNWLLQRHIPNKYPHTTDPEHGSCADFYIYQQAHPADRKVIPGDRSNA